MIKHVLCEASTIREGMCKAFRVGARGVALYNVDGVFYATQDFCRHKGGSLGKGTLEGSVVRCPLHGWKFNVTSGDCLTHPHCKRLQLFVVEVVDGEVVVEL